MKLPCAEQAFVEREKIVDYLLNAAHPYGASKAAFFHEFGFNRGSWERLAQALLHHAQSHEVTKTTDTPFGPRYEVEGELSTPDGRQPRVRSVWQWDHGQIAPRLITAYPAPRHD